MFRTDDPVSDFERYDAEQEALLEQCPICVDCGENIQHYGYLIGDEWYCPDCMEQNFRKKVHE